MAPSLTISGMTSFSTIPPPGMTAEVLTNLRSVPPFCLPKESGPWAAT